MKAVTRRGVGRALNTPARLRRVCCRLTYCLIAGVSFHLRGVCLFLYAWARAGLFIELSIISGLSYKWKTMQQDRVSICAHVCDVQAFPSLVTVMGSVFFSYPLLVRRLLVAQPSCVWLQRVEVLCVIYSSQRETCTESNVRESKGRFQDQRPVVVRSRTPNFSKYSRPYSIPYMAMYCITESLK